MLSVTVVLVFSHLVDITYSVGTAQWNALNASVEGRLFRGTPFARPCFSLSNTASGTFDPAECSTVIDGYSDHFLRSETFGAYMNTQWETCQANSSQCLLDSSSPNNTMAFEPPRVCSQGSVSEFYIDVRTPADVVAGFQFAKSTGTPLVIKNTGHDYKGRSSAPGSLALWMHNLQNVSFNNDFVPTGCPSSKNNPGVTFGAGVVFNTLYEFADENNITLPGGSDTTVGAAGGYLQGGGHSALSNLFGLAVDRALQFEVVTPTGRHLFANECQNSDLFFALRGGGGGTFGVVMSVTMLALPAMTIPTVIVEINPTAANQRKFLQFLTANSLGYAQEGWGGYITLSGAILINPLLDQSAVNNSMAALNTLVTERLQGNLSYLVVPTFSTLIDTFIQPIGIPVGLPFTTASRLIPADKFKSTADQEELVDLIIAAAGDVELPLIFATTPFHFGDKGGTSVTNAWRSSLWHVTFSDSWNFNTTFSERRQIYGSVSNAANPLRDFTPGSGAYQNEADVYEPDFASSFWGENYDELLAIKNKYDPEHLLDCWQCVGWKGPSSPRYQCYVTI